MLKDLIIAGVVFVIVCVVAVKYKSWFAKTSTEVSGKVDDVIANVKNDTSTPTDKSST